MGDSISHDWKIKHLPVWRRYRCSKCNCEVQEKKNKESGLWDALKSSFDPAPSLPMPVPAQQSANTPAGPPAQNVRARPRAGEDGERRSSGSATVVPPGHSRNRGQTRKSSSTTSSAPLLHLSTATSEPPALSVLVAINPKPLVPVATPNLGTCPKRQGPGIEHKWTVGPANAFSRKYVCDFCQTKVDERKREGRWVNFDMIRR